MEMSILAETIEVAPFFFPGRFMHLGTTIVRGGALLLWLRRPSRPGD